MNGLSDLELVAQAMGPTHDPSTAPKQEDLADKRDLPTTATTANELEPQNPRSSQPSQTVQPASEISQSTRQTLQSLGLNIDSISPSDLDSLRPILEAMTLEVSGDADELHISEILAQMDAADGVASDLEGKLDLLLAQLEKTEGEMQAALPK